MANRTFLLLIVTGLLPSLVAALVMVQTQQALLSKRSQTLQQSADNLAQTFAQRLQTASAQLGSLAKNQLLVDRRISLQAKLSRMRQALVNSEIFDQLFLLGSNGKILISTAPGAPPDLPRDFLQQALDGQTGIHGPVVIEEKGPEGLLLTATVSAENQKSSQILVGFCNQKTFAADMESFVQGQSGVAMLASADGHILAGSIPSLVGRRLQLGSAPSSADSKVADPIAKLLDKDIEYFTAGSTLAQPGLGGANSWKVIVAQGRNEVLQSTRQSATWSLLTVVVITPVVLILGLFFSRSMSRGLGTLITATQNIARGDLRPIPANKSYREIAELAETFNQMTASLAKSRAQVKEYQHHLENLVDQRTRQLQEKSDLLVASNQELKLQANHLEQARKQAVQAHENLKAAQTEIVQMEKMSSLGQLVAGIAHEMNTPIGAVFNCVDQMHNRLSDLPGYLQLIRSISERQMQDLLHLLARALDAPTGAALLLPPAQRHHLIQQVQKVGVTDNPRQVAEILGRFGLTEPDDLKAVARLAQQHDILALLRTFGDLCQCSKITRKSADKLAGIIQALRYYSHADSDTLGPMDLRESLSNTLVIMQNRTKALAEVRLDLPDDLPSICGQGSLSQVWTNLINNAVDAIEDRGPGFDTGRLEISAQRVNDNHLAVTIGGNGKPIPSQDRSRIFDPFFTTKGVGRGCGLGLSVVTGIVNRHQGKVEFQSNEDWTSFTVTLPLERTDEHPVPEDQLLCNMR